LSKYAGKEEITPAKS
jgi:hypothetical protein